MILVIIVVVLFAGLFIYAYLAQKKREKAMADLALQRGWAALGSRPEVLRGYLPRYLQGLGQNGYVFRNEMTRTTEIFDMAYQANVSGDQVVFFQYQYTEYYFEFDPATNQERESSETHTFVVLTAELALTMPTILLLHHSFLSKLATFGEHTGLQSLSLEGDFNNYFDTYIAPESQVDALSLLTPDTMELVVSVANGASMQVLDQSITLSFENKLLTPKVIEPVLDNMAKLIANIKGKADSKLQTMEQTDGMPANQQPPTAAP